jgi:hypothetical protein
MQAAAFFTRICVLQVTKWNKAAIKIGGSSANDLNQAGTKCPSGFTARPDTTASIEASVLAQTIVQNIWPSMVGNPDYEPYICPEGLKWIQYSQISSCIGNNARNPRFAKVNGLYTYVCKNQARARNITVEADVVYNKVC